MTIKEILASWSSEDLNLKKEECTLFITAFKNSSETDTAYYQYLDAFSTRLSVQFELYDRNLLSEDEKIKIDSKLQFYFIELNKAAWIHAEFHVQED